jgi:hypothetical protein
MSTYAMPLPRPSRRARLCACTALVSGLVLWPPSPVLAGQPLQLVHLAEGRLTVAAHDAGLRALVQEIVRESDLQLEGEETLRGEVTVRFRRQTLEAGLAQILRGWRYALIAETRATAGGLKSTVTTLCILEAPSALRREPAAPDERIGSPGREAAAPSPRADPLPASDDGSLTRRAGLAALRDPDRDVRAAAVRVLGAHGGDDAVSLLELALRDSELGIRLAAVEALGHIGGNRAARGLTAALHDRSRRLRLRAVSVLGAIGGPTASELLAYVKAVDRDEAVRASAVARLTELRAEP